MGRGGRWGWEPGDSEWGSYGNYPGYVSAEERKRRAQDALKKLGKELGREPLPVPPSSGRTLAKTFWGKSWNENLERYSDISTRLPRGRSYVREGSVIDLFIAAGRIDARVAGTETYAVEVRCHPVAPGAWKSIRQTAAGKIDSVVEMLAGKLPDVVMQQVTQKDGGLFPTNREISFTCSCPDSAHMCKHVAAVLYAIGIRLDTEPQLLFTLRGVDPKELVSSESVDWLTLRPASKRVLKESAIASIFGVDLVKEKEAVYRVRKPKKKVPAKKRRAK